ncbi:MAG: AAA family ATPase [Halanaerobiales bacterium]|nr:AAA family ATPase [Halanaerobiales bacterium]
MKKRLPIGVSDFKEIIEDDYYYVDKSLFIQEIVDTDAKVLLIPRPRRFGKTLNISMLKYFFEKTDIDYSYLFKDLAISKTNEIYLKHQGRYPVIYLTFKDVKEDNWQNALLKIKKLIAQEFKRHDYLLNSSKLDRYEKERYKQILSIEAEEVFYVEAFKDLSEYLRRYWDEKVLIMIDEYDAPIQTGYIYGYYDKVVNFTRTLLGGGLKDNPSLEKGILTGILRVAKESIFSGLNNLSVYSLLNAQFDQHFGLLEEEVKYFLDSFGLIGIFEDAKRWYNGYQFGEKTVYNPWSVVKLIDNKGIIQPYWVNTSSNDLVKKFIAEAGSGFKKDLEILIDGESVNIQVDENITFDDIRSKSTLFSFLLLSGYLKVEGKKWHNGRLFCDLQIPNEEVRYIYEDIIINWFKENLCSDELDIMWKSLISGEIAVFEEIFQKFVLNSVSFFDLANKEPEVVYHAFVLGMLVYLQKDYDIKSNRESGYGRYDVMLIPRTKKLGIIMEFKKVNLNRGETLVSTVEAALQQIEDRQYRQELLNRGVDNIIELGIAFEGKRIKVKEKMFM